MFHWQLVVLFILFLTTICISWPLEDNDSKTCFSFTNSLTDNKKCSAYCTQKGKKGGSCTNKRCVCSSSSDDDDQGENNRKLSFRTKSTSNIGLRSCQLYCKNLGKLNGSRINGLCVCSEL